MESPAIDSIKLNEAYKILNKQLGHSPRKVSLSELDSLQKAVLSFGAQFPCVTGWEARNPVDHLMRLYNYAYPAGRAAYLSALRTSPSQTLREFGFSEQALADAALKPIEMRFTALDGRKVDLANMRGKVVLIDFWNTGCSPCIKEFPHMKELYEKYRAEGFEIIGVAMEEDSSKKPILEKMIKNKQLPWPQHFDPRGQTNNEYMRRFGFNGVPRMLLLDRNGLLVSTKARGKRLEPLVRQYLGLNP